MRKFPDILMTGNIKKSPFFTCDRTVQFAVSISMKMPSFRQLSRICAPIVADYIIVPQKIFLY